MRTPVVLLTGVDPEAMATAMVSLQFDLPYAVAVRHHITLADPLADTGRHVLERTVSDVTGVIERHEVDLEHACVSCAIREDVLPTFERLAADGRWASIVAHLPFGASAHQVCAVVEHDQRLARRLRVAAVVAAVVGPGIVDDLLGDDLLVERGLQTGPDDNRGVGEVACSLVEGADAVAVHDAAGLSLLVDLARPDAQLVASTAQLDGARLLGDTVHDHARTRAWTDPARTTPLPPAPQHSWRVDLRSDRAFHPARMLEQLDRLGGGRHRSRGCFWVPTRSDDLLAWDGAGGQLSVGRSRPWGRQPRHTRIVLSGVGTPPADLEAAFDDMLLRPAEEAGPWRSTTDGLEAWLGPIRDVA